MVPSHCLTPSYKAIAASFDYKVAGQSWSNVLMMKMWLPLKVQNQLHPTAAGQAEAVLNSGEENKFKRISWERILFF